MKYMVSGGGTGGHIYPALAIIEEIKAQDEEAEILYVGTENGLEATLVPKEGIDFETVRVKGLPRKINKELFIALREAFRGVRDANRLIKDFKPDIVIGTGGYVSGPLLLMAKKNRVPAMIHEQNAYPGVTNKILGRFVDKIAVTFEDSVKYFKKKKKVVVTGNPIRKEIVDIDKDKAYRELDVKKDLPFVLSFGGSGGQYQLNEAMIGLIEDESFDSYQLMHITGHRLEEDFMKKLDKNKDELEENLRILPYMYNMPQALNIADLVITSAGAITLSELAAVGVPSILIPKSYTAENHQEYNAKAFENAGASKLILEKNLNSKVLKDSIDELLEDKSRLEEMSQNAKTLGNIDAGKKIVDIINTLISKK